MQYYDQCQETQIMFVDVPFDSCVIPVIGVDLDPGDLGLMNFTALHPNFTIETLADGKNGDLFSVG